MDNNYICGFCNVSNDGQEYTYFDSLGMKKSFFLSYNPMWEITSSRYVCMMPDGDQAMILAAGNRSPYNAIHPIQILNWSAIQESSLRSLWDQMVFSEETKNAVVLTTKTPTSLLHGVVEVLLLDESSDLLCSGYCREPEPMSYGYHPKTAEEPVKLFCRTDRKFISWSSFQKHIASDNGVALEVLRYESFEAKVILPKSIDDIGAAERFLDSLDSKTFDILKSSVSEYEDESGVFAREFRLEPPFVKPYLTARSLFKFWKEAYRVKPVLPTSSFLQQLQTTFGITFRKEDLPSFKTIISKENQVEIPVDIKEFGEAHHWEKPMMPEAYRILWARTSPSPYEPRPPQPFPRSMWQQLNDEEKKKIADEFWASREGVTAEASLRELLEAKPSNLANLGEFSRKVGMVPADKKDPGRLKGIISHNGAFEVKGFWCGLSGKPDSYWELLPPVPIPAPVPAPVPVLSNEASAVIQFWEKLKEAGWFYSLRDIVRFHTSVKTGALTILSGASGVGKSSLFKHYACFATACKEEGDLWKRINVVSTWMEPSDMLGWSRPLANGDSAFHYAPGGLQNFLEGLQNDEKSSKLSFLCFEEMNLAQAELYFSDFLQATSDPVSERKVINPKGKSFDISSLRIVGTCNIDHTTKPFTARFLDRCNYIDLLPSPEGQDSEHFFPKELPKIPDFQGLSLPDFGNESETSPDSIREVLKDKEAWMALVEALRTLEVFPGGRVRMAMVEYIQNRPAIGTTKEEILEEKDRIMRGVDETIAQRVLPKLILRNDWDRDVSFTKTMNEKLLPACRAMHMDLSEQFCERILASSSKARG